MLFVQPSCELCVDYAFEEFSDLVGVVALSAQNKGQGAVFLCPFPDLCFVPPYCSGHDDGGCFADFAPMLHWPCCLHR